MAQYTETPLRSALLSALYDARPADYKDLRALNSERKLQDRQRQLTALMQRTDKKTRRYNQLVLERRLVIMKRVVQYGRDPPFAITLDRAMLQLSDCSPGIKESVQDKAQYKRDATLVLLKYMYAQKSDDELVQLCQQAQ